MLLKELYNDWFTNKEYWFSQNTKFDTYLCDKYMLLLSTNSNIIHSKIELIALIIAYDQIPRHYCRVYGTLDVNFYSEKAANLSKQLLQSYNDFNIDELCFIYLPFRHINDIEYIYKIIAVFIDLYNNTTDKKTCKRYLTNTLEKSYKIITTKTIQTNKTIKSWNDINKDILDNTKQSYITTNIETIILQQYNKIKTNETIAVSLSGGVDSMVALCILQKYHKNIIAIHINYNNSETSNDELDFINYYCNYLNVKLLSRTIDEIKRKQCLNNGLRDLYEDITKKIRFDMYKLSNAKYILLGHNKDDCFENIITNISNKANYDNLLGMSTLSYIDNISIWRPMLDIKKSEIIAYANNNNIPYLGDSTPKWSMRGKIRDNVRPVLDNLNIINSFFSLSDYLSETNIIISVIVDSLVSKLEYDNIGYRGVYTKSEIKMIKMISISKMFFKKLNIKVSHKALKDFSHIGKRKFIINKNYMVIINNFNFTIFKMESVC